MNHTLPSILFVEDEPEVRFELERFLKRYSQEVIVATNGEEGLKYFKEKSPDIVISDIKMPKMNGIDMAKKIKKISPDQIIIFTTAHSDNNYFLEAIEMQVDGYILKPVDLGLLKKKINKISASLQVERQQKLYKNVLQDIAQMQNTMLAVYNEKKEPIFYNKKLLDFLGHTSIDDFLKKHTSLSEKFKKKEGCYYHRDTHIHWVEQLHSLEEHQRVISMQNIQLSKESFFSVSFSKITENNNIIITFSEITSIINEKHHYKHEAYTDELTQIYNRTKFNLLFKENLKSSKNNQSNLSIILLDIDNFKELNDKYGHAKGDKVLKMFTKLVSANIRIADSFSRWGGEEFVVLLPHTSLQEAKNIAENLRILIEKYDFTIDKKLTCSFGVTQAHSQDTITSLFERVDNALYQAKNKGRNRVIVKM